MVGQISLVVVAVLMFVENNNGKPARTTRSTDLIYNHYGPGTHCEVSGQLVPHGQVFEDPSMSSCLQHQCVYGTSYVVSEGCEGGDRVCHEVGSTWEERCITYTCTKTTVEAYNYFQPIVQQARCLDAFGECHEPGEMFTYRLNGRLMNNCRCNVTDYRIHYRCF